MSTPFKFSFEQVELLSGLKPDQSVYLLMQVKAYDPATPDNPFYTEVIGGLSPDDANDLSGNIVSGSGFYGFLKIGAPVRNDLPDSFPVAPRFSLGPIDLEPYHVVELSIILAPEVWFTTVNVPPSGWDKALVTIFTTALGAGGFGIVGAIAGGVLGFLGFSASDEDVPAPCYNVVIGARHQWTGAEVASMAGQMLQFGPTGPDPSYGCDRIDSFYWLSIAEQMQFASGPAWKKGDCTLDPVLDAGLAPRLQNNWGDRGDVTLDCGRAVVFPGNPGTWNVQLFEPGVPGSPVEFHNIPVTLEIPTPVFRRNIYPNKECPARSVLPNCPMCSRFTNVDNGMYIPGKMIAGVGLRASHIGSRPLLALKFDNDKILGAGPTSFVPLDSIVRAQAVTSQHSSKAGKRRKAKTSSQPLTAKVSANPSAALRINPSTTMYKPTDGMVVLSGKWNIAQRDVSQSGVNIGDLLKGITLRLSPEKVLYLYGEYPATGDLQCFRLRYRHTGDDGQTLTDIMLLPDAAIIR